MGTTDEIRQIREDLDLLVMQLRAIVTRLRLLDVE